MYSMCRKSEVLRARWREFDLEKGQLDLPAERMKMKQPHRVYLSRQAVELLTLLTALGSEPQAYVVPSILRSSVPLGEATLNHFFKRLDFGVQDFSPHGTGGTAATLLREHGFSRDVVELLLGHAERNKVTAAYYHHEMAEERRTAAALHQREDRPDLPATWPRAFDAMGRQTGPFRTAHWQQEPLGLAVP